MVLSFMLKMEFLIERHEGCSDGLSCCEMILLFVFKIFLIAHSIAQHFLMHVHTLCLYYVKFSTCCIHAYAGS